MEDAAADALLRQRGEEAFDQVADSDACRSPIPMHADHGFRCMPITLGMSE